MNIQAIGERAQPTTVLEHSTVATGAAAEHRSTVAVLGAGMAGAFLRSQETVVTTSMVDSS